MQCSWCKSPPRSILWQLQLGPLFSNIQSLQVLIVPRLSQKLALMKGRDLVCTRWCLASWRERATTHSLFDSRLQKDVIVVKRKRQSCGKATSRKVTRRLGGRWEEADCKGGSLPTVPWNLRERFSESIASTLSNLSYAWCDPGSWVISRQDLTQSHCAEIIPGAHKSLIWEKWRAVLIVCKYDDMMSFMTIVLVYIMTITWQLGNRHVWMREESGAETESV